MKKIGCLKQVSLIIWALVVGLQNLGWGGVELGNSDMSINVIALDSRNFDSFSDYVSKKETKESHIDWQHTTIYTKSGGPLHILMGEKTERKKSAKTNVLADFKYTEIFYPYEREKAIRLKLPVEINALSPSKIEKLVIESYRELESRFTSLKN